MPPLPESFVIFDLEYTSWEGSHARGWDRPGEYREIVQIGAVCVDGETLIETDTFLILVKPEKNPILSDYFTKLTGITQKEVEEKGLSLAEALQKFSVWTAGRELYCFGHDGSVMEDNCKLMGIDSLFRSESFRDIRDYFKEAGVDVSLLSSGTLTHAFGREPKHRAHNALSDACTILDGLRELKARGIV